MAKCNPPTARIVKHQFDLYHLNTHFKFNPPLKAMVTVLAVKNGYYLVTYENEKYYANIKQLDDNTEKV